MRINYVACCETAENPIIVSDCELVKFKSYLRVQSNGLLRCHDQAKRSIDAGEPFPPIYRRIHCAVALALPELRGKLCYVLLISVVLGLQLFVDLSRSN